MTIAAATLLRPLTPLDRDRVEQITRTTGVFSLDEVAVALDVLDAALGIGRRRDPDYETLGAESDGVLVGWICWGPTPCTLGTFDLYWIAVDPQIHGTGVGSALVREMERRLAGRARLVVVETAGRARYAATRAFYDGQGYRVSARITDYYAPGDDLVTYTKKIASGAPLPRND